LFTFLKNAIVGVLIIGLVLLFAKWKELQNLNRKDWTRLIAISIVGGSIPFLLFFNGLQHTSAVTGSLIHKTMFVWVALLAMWQLKEKFNWLQGAALVLLLGGIFALGGFQNFHMGKGGLMILAATLLWALENIIAKRALANLSTFTVVASRMVLGSIVLLGVVAFQGKLDGIGTLTFTQWGWVALPSLLLFGYVITWYSALKRAPVTLVASLLVPATFITAVLSKTFLHAPISTQSWLSGGLVTLGAMLLIWASLRAIASQHAPNPSHPDA
jgi:drug/metabolite transporter (DMT)-like permease